MKIPLKGKLLLLALFILINVKGQTAMVNYQARNFKSLNGKWKVIIDPTGI